MLYLAFLLLSALDLALTLWLGRDWEMNPLAAWIWRQQGGAGLAAFKGWLVAAIVTIAASLERRHALAAGRVLCLACAATALAVVFAYALILWLALPPRS